MNVPRFDQLLDLSGKVALVTGASQGIGAGISRRFAEAGAAVAVHYRGNAEAANAVVDSITSDGGKAVAIQGDLAQADDVNAVIAETLQAFGALDIAINNAGTFPNKALLAMSLSEWQSMYADNVETAFLCTQAAAGQMKQSSGGSIVNIASIAATVPGPEHSHYNSAKAAVVMLTRSAAQELGRFGIRVNAVSPGLIARPGIETEWPDGVARWTAQAPLERLGEPEDVADACLFLASPAARWITGHNLLVDGGIMAAKIY